MPENLKPYPAYKDPGVPWLGQVPEHWRLERTKRVCAYRKEINSKLMCSNVLSLTLRGVVNNDPNDPEGLVPQDYGTYQFFRRGDLVFKLIDLENLRTSRVGLVHEDGIMSSAYVRLVPRGTVIARFLYHQFFDLYQRAVYNQLGAGVRSTLGASDLLELPILLPSSEEQAAIVRYLDHADRKVRHAIRARQQLIKLLTEQKQAIIQRAVTRGLDPNVRLKPSGVPWLGDVPEHWEILPLKRWVSTKITDGPHETPPLMDDGIPFMSAESMVGGRFDFSHRRGFISHELHEVYCRKCRPQRDDIFMCKSGATTGKVSIVETDDKFSVWSPLALIRVSPQRILPRLFFSVLQSNYVQRQVHDTWSYGTQPNLAMEAMERLVIGLPPVNEQREILAHLEQETAPLAEAIDRAHRDIELLREYRTRLIADVVTGKLDVRDTSAHLPDEPEEQPEPLDEEPADDVPDPESEEDSDGKQTEG